MRHRDDAFSHFEDMYKSGEPFQKTPQHNRACQTNLPLTMALVQKKRALDPETSDMMSSIKRKKILEGLVKEDNAKEKIECDIPRVSRTGALSSVTTERDKVEEEKFDCDVPDAFLHDIANCTGIHDVEGYLELKKSKNDWRGSYSNCVVSHYFHFMNNHPDLIAKKRKRFPELAKRLEEHYRNVLSPLPVRTFPWSSSLWEKISKEHRGFILYHAFFLRAVECCALHDPQRAEEHENIIREVWGD